MKLAIIGCGLIGQKRAAAALARSHRIAVVCDRDTTRAEALAQRTKARAVRDWRDAIGAEVDAVIVATSHDSLAAVVVGAVQAGKHVLVEKPAGRNLDELLRARDAARAAGVAVKVGFNHRFHPGLARAKELAADGVLGPLYYIRGRYGHGGRVGYENEWRCQREVSGGGELIDQGSHLIDLSRWFFGDLVLDYASLPIFFWNIAVEDNCFLALSGQDRRTAWLHATWTEWKNMFSFEITGRDGKLTIDGLGGSYGVERQNQDDRRMIEMPAVAVLAGGLATRLRPRTETVPKAMLEVAGEPFIAHQLAYCGAKGITRVVLCVGYLHEQIEAFVGDGAAFGLTVIYRADGARLLGTGQLEPRTQAQDKNGKRQPNSRTFSPDYPQRRAADLRC